MTLGGPLANFGVDVTVGSDGKADELIHMNGRVYDYNVGRFTGVDPLVQFPLNSQSLASVSGKIIPIQWVSGGHGHWDTNNDFSGTDWNWMKKNSDGNMYLAPRDGNLYKSNWKNAYPYGTGTNHNVPPYTPFPGKKVPDVKIDTTWP